jgi:hypothetical protein
VIWRNPSCVWLLVLCAAATPSLAQPPASDILLAPKPASTSPAGTGSTLVTTCSATLGEGRTVETLAGAGETSSIAQPLSGCMTKLEQSKFVGRFIEEKLSVWQQRLKLEDWQISVAMTRRDNLKPKTLGGIRWDKRKKSAVMAVLDPSEYRLPFREMLDDMEFTIVHELVHLELASLPRSEASRSSEEHAVNQITDALLRLDRGR